MLAIATPRSSVFDRALAAVRAAKAAAESILSSTSGFGHTTFEIDAHGELVPTLVTITHQPKRNEDDDAFVARLRATDQWRFGDGVLFKYNNGTIQNCHITRHLTSTGGSETRP